MISLDDWSVNDFAGLGAYTDGGTADFRFDNQNGADLIIRLAQHMHLGYWDDAEPGRLYINGTMVPLRSEMEARLRSMLIDLEGLARSEQLDRAIVVESFRFVGSPAYFRMAEDVSAMKANGYPGKFGEGRNKSR